MEIVKKYTNKDITVIWKPTICIHSAKCFKNLPNVFEPRRVPWIIMDNASTELIIDTINKCPSGAISYIYNSDVNKED